MISEQEWRRTGPRDARPGNFGGKTLREYCGLKSPRTTYRKTCESGRPVTAQDIYRAIVAHGGPK